MFPLFSKNKRLRIADKFKKEIEPQEVFLDKLFRSRQEEVGLSEKKIEVPLSKRFIQSIYLIFLILIVILFGKTFQIQFVQGEEFSRLARNNQFIAHEIQAHRGVIYDKDFNQLVFNKINFDLVCHPEEIPQNEKERKRMLDEISLIIEKEVQLPDSFSDFLVLENLNYQQLIIFRTREKDFPGFEVISHAVREYREGEIFSHLIGYQRKTGEKTGLEEFYEEYLKENSGEIKIQRDAMGTFTAEKVESMPESGKSLVLWVDSDLQKKVYEELKKSIENAGSERGVGVVLDVKTGGVLSLVSIPSFDNNLFSQGMSAEQWEEISNDIREPLFNKVISGTYPTGSTIKPLIASAALEENIISPDKKILCTGEIVIKSPWDEEVSWTYHDWSVHGWTDIRKAIAQSCNVFFYTIGGGYKDIEGLGVEKMKKYLELFGWGNTTGIDLSGEEEGFIPDKEWKKNNFQENVDKIWMPGDDYHLAIGQGDLRITPLQVAVAFVAIANKGILYKPRVVQKIVDENKNIIQEFEPQINNQNFISQETLQIVREGMRQTVTDGSATNWLNSLPVKAAVKTGTAQTGKEDYYHNWITVFAPYEDPEIVMTLMVENVEGMKAVTLPLARDILNWYFSQKEQE